MSRVEELISVVREHPSEAVDKLLGMARTLSARPSSATPYVPVKLRGLWNDMEITEADLRQARKEMWRKFEDSEAA
jgi:hypothetical protein